MSMARVLSVLRARLRERAAANARWTGQQRFSLRVTAALGLLALLVLRNSQPNNENVVLYGLCLAALCLPFLVGPRVYTAALLLSAVAGALLARQAGDLLILFLVLIGMAGSQLPLLLAAITGVGIALLFTAVQFHSGATASLLQSQSWFAATFAATVATHIRRVAAARQTAMVAELERSNAELRLAHEQLRLDSQRAAELAAAEERERIAREIHDVLAHTLTVLAVQVAAVKRLVSRDPVRAQQQLDLIAQLTRDGLSEVRRSVHALHSTDEEGVPAISALIADFAERTGATCTFNTAGDVPLLTPALSKALYRVTQEALTNAVRHGHAQVITVCLSRDAAQLTLSVEDDGVGAAVPPPIKGGGNGLPGAAARLHAFGGRLTAHPGPAGGFTVRASVPLTAPTEQSNRLPPGNALSAAEVPTGGSC